MSEIRNVAVMAHSGAGKTSLGSFLTSSGESIPSKSDMRLLFSSGEFSKLCRQVQ